MTNQEIFAAFIQAYKQDIIDDLSTGSCSTYVGTCVTCPAGAACEQLAQTVEYEPRTNWTAQYKGATSSFTTTPDAAAQFEYDHPELFI